MDFRQLVENTHRGLLYQITFALELRQIPVSKSNIVKMSELMMKKLWSQDDVNAEEILLEMSEDDILEMQETK